MLRRVFVSSAKDASLLAIKAMYGFISCGLNLIARCFVNAR